MNGLKNVLWSHIYCINCIGEKGWGIIRKITGVRINNVVSEKVFFVVTSYVRFALSCFIYEKMKFKVIVYVALQLEFDREEVYVELTKERCLSYWISKLKEIVIFK